MGNLMEAVFKSIDEAYNLKVIRYSQSADGEVCFYLLEQSSLQVLREFPLETPIHITEFFSYHIAQHTDTIKAAKSIKELFDVVLPLEKDGSIPCVDLTIVINETLQLQSHDDGEVHLSSKEQPLLEYVIRKVLLRQHFSVDLISSIIHQPNLYHKLKRPNRIVNSFPTFDEVIDAI